MLKSCTQVGFSHDVTSIAFVSSQESQIPSPPVPLTHGSALEFCANAMGAINSKQVATVESEMAAQRMLAMIGYRQDREESNG